MKIDIWSDIVWHSFELDPTIEAEPTMSLVDKIATKYGMSTEQSVASQEDVASRAAAVGLEFNWRDAKFGNTFDAHRLTHLAVKHGLGDQAQQKLMLAYFTEGRCIGNADELQKLGEEIGLPADEVHALLAGNDYADAVRADEALAQQYGISSVPFFVFDDKYAVSGAQPVELFAQALQQSWDERQPKFETLSATDAPSCDGDNCTI